MLKSPLYMGLFINKLMGVVVIGITSMASFLLIPSSLEASFESSVYIADLLEQIGVFNKGNNLLITELHKDLVPKEVEGNNILVAIDEDINEPETTLIYYLVNMFESNENVKRAVNNDFSNFNVVEYCSCFMKVNKLDHPLLKVDNRNLILNCAGHHYNIACCFSLDHPSNDIVIKISKIKYSNHDSKQLYVMLDVDCYCKIFETNLNKIKEYLDDYIELNDMYPKFESHLSNIDLPFENIYNNYNTINCMLNACKAHVGDNRDENKESQSKSGQHSLLKDSICEISFNEPVSDLKSSNTCSSNRDYLNKKRIDVLYCTWCNVMFDDKHSLKKHAVIHKEVMPRQCFVCGDKFKNTYTLQKHIKDDCKHSECICFICKKNYANRDNLSHHMRHHTMSKFYQCDLCNKLFVRKDYLEEHYRRHTGEKPFKCKICDKRYYSNSSLRKHKCKKTY